MSFIAELHLELDFALTRHSSSVSLIYSNFLYFFDFHDICIFEEK